MNAAQGNKNAAGSIFGFPGGQTVNFSPMPAVNMPQKADLPRG